MQMAPFTSMDNVLSEVNGASRSALRGGGIASLLQREGESPQEQEVL